MVGVILALLPAARSLKLLGDSSGLSSLLKRLGDSSGLSWLLIAKKCVIPELRELGLPLGLGVPLGQPLELGVPLASGEVPGGVSGEVPGELSSGLAADGLLGGLAVV